MHYFPTLPPEIWELIITDHHLYGLKYIKTIKMIPSRHCIMETVYNQLIQPYIDNTCKLFYSKCKDAEYRLLIGIQLVKNL